MLHCSSNICRQMELRKVSQEKEKAQAENDKLMYDLERVATQNNKSQSALEKSQEEVARLQVSPRKRWPDYRPVPRRGGQTQVSLEKGTRLQSSLR